MRTNNTTCRACGGMLQRSANNTLTCMRCFRRYAAVTDSNGYLVVTGNVPRTNTTDSTDTSWKIGIAIIFFFLGLVLAACGAFPIMVPMVISGSLLIKSYKENKAAPQPVQYRQTPSVPVGSRVQSLLTDFRYTAAEDMPLGIYAKEAIYQLQALNRKQQGIHAMLPSAHPFLETTDQAETYILHNCKQILNRLKFVDQSDPNRNKEHAEYLRSKLEENAKILNDFENLIIEVTEMDDTSPVPVPSLDILADSLRTARTPGADWPEFEEDPSNVTMQMMQRQRF